VAVYLALGLLVDEELLLLLFVAAAVPAGAWAAAAS
jgi:hypothetical protein